MKLILPWPESVNSYWQSRAINVKGKWMSTVYVSARGKAFQQNVAKAVTDQIGQHQPINGRLGVLMTFHQPNARACDISNFVKSTEDALTKAGVWLDDSQIDREFLIRGPIDRKNPRVEVEIRVLRSPERTLLS